jgi:hypothetical protein
MLKCTNFVVGGKQIIVGKSDEKSTNLIERQIWGYFSTQKQMFLFIQKILARTPAGEVKTWTNPSSNLQAKVFSIFLQTPDEFPKPKIQL